MDTNRMVDCEKGLVSRRIFIEPAMLRIPRRTQSNQ